MPYDDARINVLARRVARICARAFSLFDGMGCLGQGWLMASQDY
ncbi:MAG: hypothetical protein ACI9W2_002831 [Gammaproteobacteria bacterium]|jgi:hypothetical protein